MIIPSPIGVYGKLPGYGDFVHRNLANDVIGHIDGWLQLFISSTNDALGENWLDIYLTSPIWRFVFSAGVINEYHWAGIVLPSVDQVGRYFPLVLLKPIMTSANPLTFINDNVSWFEQLEEQALLALDDQLTIDELVEKCDAIELNLDFSYQSTGQLNSGEAMMINQQFTEELPMATYGYLLDSLLVKTMSSYSVWSTIGSENIEPCLFTTQGLPKSTQIPAMLDGQWQERHWSVPYIANRFTHE